MPLKGIIEKIKKKRTLSRLDETLVRKEIDKLLRENKKTREKIKQSSSFKDIERSKEVKQLVKEARDQINRVYGIYQVKDSDKAQIDIDELKKDKSEKTHKKLLEKHLSSKERVAFYHDFYKKIFEITKKPKSILDIACGLNPVSLYYMDLKDIEYTAIELNSWEVDIVNQYFEIMNINGKAYVQDINLDQNFPKADICFAFKIFDILENRTVNKIIRNLDVKYVIASFPKLTAKGKPMKFPRRMTFERTLKKLNLQDYQIIEFPNEIIYIIKK